MHRTSKASKLLHGCHTKLEEAGSTTGSSTKRSYFDIRKIFWLIFAFGALAVLIADRPASNLQPILPLHAPSKSFTIDGYFYFHRLLDDDCKKEICLFGQGSAQGTLKVSLICGNALRVTLHSFAATSSSLESSSARIHDIDFHHDAVVAGRWMHVAVVLDTLHAACLVYLNGFLAGPVYRHWDLTQGLYKADSLPFSPGRCGSNSGVDVYYWNRGKQWAYETEIMNLRTWPLALTHLQLMRLLTENILLDPRRRMLFPPSTATSTTTTSAYISKDEAIVRPRNGPINSSHSRAKDREKAMQAWVGLGRLVSGDAMIKGDHNKNGEGGGSERQVLADLWSLYTLLPPKSNTSKRALPDGDVGDVSKGVRNGNKSAVHTRDSPTVDLVLLHSVSREDSNESSGERLLEMITAICRDNRGAQITDIWLMDQSRSLLPFSNDGSSSYTHNPPRDNSSSSPSSLPEEILGQFISRQCRPNRVNILPTKFDEVSSLNYVSGASKSNYLLVMDLAVTPFPLFLDALLAGIGCSAVAIPRLLYPSGHFFDGGSSYRLVPNVTGGSLFMPVGFDRGAPLHYRTTEQTALVPSHNGFVALYDRVAVVKVDGWRSGLAPWHNHDLAFRLHRFKNPRVNCIRADRMPMSEWTTRTLQRDTKRPLCMTEAIVFVPTAVGFYDLDRSASVLAKNDPGPSQVPEPFLFPDFYSPAESAEAAAEITGDPHLDSAASSGSGRDEALWLFVKAVEGANVRHTFTDIRVEKRSRSSSSSSSSSSSKEMSKQAGEKTSVSAIRSSVNSSSDTHADKSSSSALTVLWHMHCGGSMGYEATMFLEQLEPMVNLRTYPPRFGRCEHVDTIGSLPAFYRDSLQRTRLNDAVPDVIVFHRDYRTFSQYIDTNNDNNNIHQAPNPFSSSAAYLIGRYMYEADGLHKAWVDHSNALDEIWVPSKFHADLWRSQGVMNPLIRVVPEAIDTDLFDPAIVQPLVFAPLRLQQPLTRWFSPSPSLSLLRRSLPSGLSHYSASSHRDAIIVNTLDSKSAMRKGQRKQRKPVEPWRFLSVFKLEDRKGWRELMKAYYTTFTKADNVELVLHTYLYNHPGNQWDANRILRVIHDRARLDGYLPADLAALPVLRIIGRRLSTGALRSLYKAVDCYVQPSYGEGWGLPFTEAMAMQLPLVATNWSGQTEFLSERIGYPVAVEKMIPCEGDAWFRGFRWALPSVSHLRKILNHVYTHQDEARRKGVEGRRLILQRYTTPKVASLIADELARIARSASFSLLKQQQRQQTRAPVEDLSWEALPGLSPELMICSHIARPQPNDQSQSEEVNGTTNVVNIGLGKGKGRGRTLTLHSKREAGERETRKLNTPDLLVSTTGSQPSPRRRLHLSLRNQQMVSPLRIAILSSYPPTMCGIAEYTSNLVRGLLDSEEAKKGLISIEIIATFDDGGSHEQHIPAEWNITFNTDLGGSGLGVGGRWEKVGHAGSVSRLSAPRTSDSSRRAHLTTHGEKQQKQRQRHRQKRLSDVSVSFVIRRGHFDDYISAAAYVNNNIDALLIEHEFGLFGGSGGAFVVCFLRSVSLTVPVITNIHTLHEWLSDAEQKVLREISQNSNHVLAMSRLGVRYLNVFHHVSNAVMIPHGVMDASLVSEGEAGRLKDRFGWTNRTVLLSVGLHHPEKGFDVALESLIGVVRAVPSVLFVIAGRAHPRCGDCYKYSQRLKRIIKEYKLGAHVILIERYSPREELLAMLRACDVYLSLYTGAYVSSSGTVSSAMANGKPVVATPYIYTKEVLSEGRGVLVPFNDPHKTAEALVRLMSLSQEKRRKLGEKAYRYTHEAMLWTHIARARLDLIFADPKTESRLGHFFNVMSSSK